MEEEYPYVGIDLETTGFSSTSDEIIEISVIEFNLKGEIGRKLNQLCYPNKGHIPEGASKVNNIYMHDVEGKPNYFDGGIREQVAEFIGTRIVMGHNFIGFDYKFLKIEIPKERQEDTLLMCREKYASGNKLKMACKRRGIAWNDEEAHRSEYDTLKCIELFVAMKADELKKDTPKNLDMFATLPGATEKDLKQIGVVPTEDDKKMFATQAYSYSRISLFHQCPFKWYMRYVKKHPEPPAPYLMTGKLCHSIAEWSAEWCSRTLFANKMSVFLHKKGIKLSEKTIKSLAAMYKIADEEVRLFHMGTFLYDNPEKIENFFPGQKGRGTLTKEMDANISEDSYEKPSMPDWETYEDIMEKAFNDAKCTDVEIVGDVKKIMTKFYEKSDFSTYIGEVTIVEKKLAFDKNWRLVRDFFSDDVFFRSVIDLINYSGRTVVIRDYKSSRSMLKQSELLNDKQLQVYLFMIYTFLPKDSYDSIVIEMDYIRFNKVLREEITDPKPIAMKALKWINQSIQEIESEMLKDDGTAFPPSRNEFCHTCHLAEQGLCALFDKRRINNIDDPETFDVLDIDDCKAAWKRIEANKVENSRLLKQVKAFVKTCSDKIVIDDKAVLASYVAEKRNFNAEKVVKELLEREIDIKFIIKFLNISPSSFEAICESQGIVMEKEELDEISEMSSKSEFKALTEEEVKKKNFLNP